MWYATVGGVQITLDVSGEENRGAAVEALARLVREAKPPPADPPPIPADPGPTVAAAVAGFLARTARRVKPHTLLGYRQFLARLTEAVGGDTPVRSLTADRVERVADRDSWSQSTRHDFIGLAGVLLRDAGHPLKLRRPRSKKGSPGIRSRRWSGIARR